MDGARGALGISFSITIDSLAADVGFHLLLREGSVPGEVPEQIPGLQ